ncbi:VOC family protein [Rhodococcus koreensis]|uniref:VOC family protein n=1 Tax=Rhodococcus koreensis TaxID=99653 RepID=UPI00366D4B98
MSFLGEPTQIAYVVKDLQTAMRHWHEKLGVGPWYYKDDMHLTEFTYYGKPVDPLPKVALAMSNSGRTQIELIELRNDAPSSWADSLAESGEGPQHIAFWAEDYDDKYTELLRRGFIEAHAGRSGTRGRFSYFTHEDVPGTVLELSEYTGEKADYFAMIAAAAADWDGTDPYRPVEGFTIGSEQAT